MGYNLLAGIRNIMAFGSNDLNGYAAKYLIRITNTGEQLEYYVRDSLAGTFRLKQDEKDASYGKCFSYMGNQNNPPDIMLKGGDAFEMKKIGKPKSGLALNSSPPKNMLYATDPRITESCRKAEKWAKKDMFYVVGHTDDTRKRLRYIFFVHGLCYAADREVYEKIATGLKSEIGKLIESGGQDAAETIELGRINKIDPLGITYLRVRGMWGIENPLRVYSSICDYDPTKEFSLFALMTEKKYGSFPKEDIKAIESNRLLKVSDVKIKNPNNRADMLDAKLITGVLK